MDRLELWARAAGLAPRLAGTALRAWITLEPADWSRVANCWADTVALLGDSPARLSVHARLLRAARRLDEAVAIGRQLVRRSPAEGSVLLELGRALRAAGQRQEAIATLRAAAAAGAQRAERDLLRYGARAQLPAPAGTVFAPEDYANFAGEFPPPPPPPFAADLQFGIRIAGDTAAQAATLASLERQTYRGWHVGRTEDDAILDLPAGAQLAPEALAWLAWAFSATGCAEARADHDYIAPNGRRCDPVLLPAPDFLWTEGPQGIARLRASLPGRTGPVAHVPLVLMSLPRAGAQEAGQAIPDAPPRRLSVIIPTRDNPELLTAAVESLLGKASQPDCIELLIVDNDSRSPQTEAAFSRLAERPGTRILRFPEPFNWSRANNQAAGVANGETLLFLNDDTVMLTPGWDRILAGLFASPAVGLAGARLVYPDGTIQHGGFVFGMDNGPQHEGRWRDADDPGPAGRWTAIRQSVAVTGAFIAVRRDYFTSLGRFDEQAFAIDFADLDLCLRVRTTGKAVVYCGAISLTHHESHSRGLNLGRAKRRRMARERAEFDRRWGDMAVQDPWYHPAWSRLGCSFDGMKAVTGDQVAAATLNRTGLSFP